MSVDEPDGRTNYQPDNGGIDATRQDENDGRDRSGQATPATGAVSNDGYTRESHKSTEQTHRSGLRQVDDHASWQAVYRACHVGVGMNE